MQKEAEVKKVVEENVKLSSPLEKKEAQLLAMNKQCKVMALSASNTQIGLLFLVHSFVAHFKVS